MTPEAEVARVCIVDTDPVLQGLLEEWLTEEGFRMVQEAPDFLIVDLHLPRAGAAGVLRALAARHPAAAVIALSSNFFPGVEASGALARELGVAAVLPKPLARAALLDALRKRLPRLA
jgi:DNA-binding response OmpR family regulator